jgi:hypothetical protein
MSTAVVKHHYGVNETMICFTKKNEHEISRSNEINAPSSTEYSCVRHLSLPLPQKLKKALLLLLLLLGVRGKPQMYRSLLAYCTALLFLNVPISRLRDAPARLPTCSAFQRQKLERSNPRY